MSSIALKSKTYKKEKISLKERFKNYVLSNSAYICGGILAMNGDTRGYYTYKMLLK